MPASELRVDPRFDCSLAAEFLTRVRRADTNAQLASEMEGVARELGFRHFALLHHIDPLDRRPGQVFLQNYPAGWAEQFVGERLYIHDPVLQASLRTCTAFRWSELSELIQLNDGHSTILRQAQREGLNEGVTVPASIPGEWTGSCSFAAPRGGRVLKHQLLIAQIVGLFGFQAARRIASGGALTVTARPVLSSRQRECTVLAGQGKTDWEIAAILGLKRVTVSHYLSDARTRYGVATRQQLIMCALLDGQISLAELAPGQYVRMHA